LVLLFISLSLSLFIGRKVKKREEAREEEEEEVREKMASGELAIPDFEDDIEYADLVLQYEIGQGAFGRVFKGSYFGTDVAIKVIALPPTPEEKTFLRRCVCIIFFF